MKINETVGAYLPDHKEPKDLFSKHPEAAISLCRFDMTSMGWIYLGQATIVLEIDDAVLRGINEKRLNALREQIKDVQAKAQMAINTLQGQINDLLAIESSIPDHEVPF